MSIRFADIDKKEVKAKANGIWDRIASQLAPSILPAIDHPGLVHIDCMMHGGNGDFRVYRDFLDSGGGVCTCGNWPDGIALIGAVNDWTFKDALSEIGRLVLGDKPQLQPVRREARRRDTAKEDAATLCRPACSTASSWIDEAGEGETADYAELSERCLEEIAGAGRLVLYCEPDEILKGAILEAGAALMAGVPVFAVGECASLSRVFRQHRLWHECPSVEDAISSPARQKR